VLIDWYLPGTKAGGPVRSVYSLVNLLKNDFDFYILTLNEDLGDASPYSTVSSDVWLTENSVHYYYFSRSNLTPDKLLSLLGELQPTLVYLNSFWSYPFSISPVRLHHAGKLKCPILLAPRGMLGQGAMGLKRFKKLAFIQLGRLLGWYGNIRFHATQAQEESDILSFFPKAQIFVAPNVNTGAVTANLTTKEPGALKLFFLSRIARVKNLHYALHVLRSVPANCRIEYDIYGNLEDKEYWGECQEIIAELPKNIRVRYCGEVAFSEVQNVLVNYHALLLPTLNENFGHSIVESLLCGCQVIISDQTPWQDVEIHGAGFAIPLVNKDRFAEALTRLCMLTQTDFNTSSKAAIEYIRKKVDLQATALLYKNMFDACTKN